jgi:alkylmercury lyase
VPNATKPRIPELAQTLTDAMPRLRPDERQLALAVYRLLAAGEPVPASALAPELGGSEAEIAATLESWPGVFRSDDGRIVSFWGLAIPEMPHRFRVDGRELHTWCAWDALFIPELIGIPAEVESHPPLSGEPVRLVVAPDGIREVVPEATVVSMLSPAEAFDQRVIMSFCHFVHFFPSPEDGAEWIAQHPGTFLLTVPEAHELGRIVNAKRFGAGLAAAREAIGGAK